MRHLTAFLVITSLVLFASSALAGDVKKTTKGGKKKVSGDFVASSSTNIDFEETLIEGKMKAPQGFYLQGRQAQSLTQMIKLRSHFRSELRNSGSAVKSIVK